MTSRFKKIDGAVDDVTVSPQASRVFDKESKKTFTSTWGKIRAINFDRMAKRDLLPKPINSNTQRKDDLDNDPQRLSSMRTTGWMASSTNSPREPNQKTFKTAIDFAKQTNRSNWLQPYKQQSAGLDYNNTGRSVVSKSGRLVPFDKTLPREQFSELNASGKKKQYFHLGSLKSGAPTSSLVDFRSMTGRDREVCLREGFTPLEVA